ncbi:MAG: dipeptidase [Thermoplasmatales archaeon]|nr:dipeptidase [Thermoplasmatales archaeon]
MIKNMNLTEELLVFDAHCDTANVLYDQSSYFIKENKSHFTIDKARTGGLKAQIFALYVNPAYAPYRTIKKALLLYNAMENKLFSSGNAVKVTSTIEMESALKKGKLACWLSLEGGHIIENSIEILELFYKLGIRCITLTHTKNTDWADSSGDEPLHDGLNKLGRKIISRMDELGMVIDVSHSSDKTVVDVLDVSSMPIMASHSCARALCDIPRNLSDDLIKEIAHRKGYFGVNFFPGFLKKSINEQVMKNIEKNTEWFKKEIEGNEDDPDIVNKAEMGLYSKIVEGNDNVDLNAIIDHIVHIAEIGGVDCVGLGSDFDGIPSTPTDLTDVSCYPVLANGLSDRGFKENEIRKIMGLNLFNFLKNFDKK